MLLLGCIAGLGLSLSRLGGLFGRPRPARALAAREPSLGELREGDAVQHGQTTLLVRRAVPLVAAGRWRALYELEADGAASVLLIGDDGAGEEEAAWLLARCPAPRPDLLTAPHSAATETLPHDGLRYRLLSRHHSPLAAVAPTAPAAALAPARLSLWCYRGPGACRLLVIRWPDEPAARLYVGESVLLPSLTVFAR